MITTLTTRKLMMFAGLFALAALALVFPTDAFATAVNTTVAGQANRIAVQAANIPKLIAVGSYVIGAFFAVKCLFALKGFISEPDDNPITGVLAYGAIGALLILLPYIISVMTNSLGAKATNQNSSAASFTANTNATFNTN